MARLAFQFSKPCGLLHYLSEYYVAWKASKRRKEWVRWNHVAQVMLVLQSALSFCMASCFSFWTSFLCYLVSTLVLCPILLLLVALPLCHPTPTVGLSLLSLLLSAPATHLPNFWQRRFCSFVLLLPWHPVGQYSVRLVVCSSHSSTISQWGRITEVLSVPE